MGRFAIRVSMGRRRWGGRISERVGGGWMAQFGGFGLGI